MINVIDYEDNPLLKTHRCVLEGITNNTYRYFTIIEADGF